jgi:hypothetical protein
MVVGSFSRSQRLTIAVFAVANFCAAVCVSLQVRTTAQFRAEKKMKIAKFHKCRNIKRCLPGVEFDL